MATLTQRLQVPRPVLGWIMVEVRTGQHHARLIPGEGRGQLSGSWQPPQRSASARPPDLMVLVPPPSIPKMIDQAAVGPPAALASPLRTAEADDGRELGPVDRVEPAMLAADRHLATSPGRLAGGQPSRRLLEPLCTDILRLARLVWLGAPEESRNLRAEPLQVRPTGPHSPNPKPS